MINSKHSNISYNKDHYHHYHHDTFITTYSTLHYSPQSHLIAYSHAKGRKQKRKILTGFLDPLGHFSSHEVEVSNQMM